MWKTGVKDFACGQVTVLSPAAVVPMRRASGFTEPFPLGWTRLLRKMPNISCEASIERAVLAHPADTFLMGPVVHSSVLVSGR